MALFISKKQKKEEEVMKNNPYATNKGGIINAPKNTGKDSPKSSVVKGNDLRVKKSK